MSDALNPKLLSMFGLGGAAFNTALMGAMTTRKDLIVLSSDMSTPAGLDRFKATFPDHFINLGIAEQNMIGVAAGLVDEGFRTIAVAQACFITMRCFEQVRQYAGYMGSNQILVGIASGFALTYFGNTHYALEDLALMRTIPGMTVIAPCDALEAVKALNAALVYDHPVYLRFFGGTGTPVVHPADFDFQIGKAISLREGHDVQLIATGSMVSVALKAADLLHATGVNTGVLDMHTIKPLDTASIDRTAKLVVSLEEHRVTGGLGDALAEALATVSGSPSLLKIAVPDVFPPVGDHAYLLDQTGLSAEKVVERIQKTLQ